MPLPSAILELSTELLAVFAHDGTIQEINAGRWRDVLGWSEDEVVGRHFAELVHPEDLTRTDELTRAAVVHGRPTRGYANRYRAKGGGYRWLLWETRELDDGRWLCAARDITAERETLAERDALRRVATKVAEAGSPTAIFATVAEEVGRLMHADAAGVVKILDRERIQVAGVWVRDRPPSFAPGEVVDLGGESVLDRALAGGVTRHPAAEAERDTIERLRRYGSSVTAPVWVGGEEWGRVTAFHMSTDGLHDDAEPRLRQFAELTAMAVANADARQELERRALTDSLTGLMNHRAFHERLAEEIARARRHGRPLAVAILDIDHFKAYNDDHGHRAGDALLVAFADAITADQRLGDAVGRIGGDEVAVALTDCDTVGAVGAIERLRAELAALPPERAIGFSAGVAALAPTGGVDEVMSRADEMLYRSKRAGRARTTSG